MANRPTVAQLSRELTELRNQLPSINHNITELQRKSRGISTANKRATRLEGSVKELERRMGSLADRIALWGEGASESKIDAFQAELKRLNGRLDTHNAELSKHIDELEGRVDVVTDRVDKHDELFDELEGHVHIVGEATASAHTRIDVLTRQVVGIPGWAYLVGAIFGIVAGLIWAARDWTFSVEGSDHVFTNSAADSWWAAVLCGLAVFLIVTVIAGGIHMLIQKSKDTTTSSSASSSADARVRTSPAPTADTPSDDPSGSEDTRVQPAAAAPSSASAAAVASNN